MARWQQPVFRRTGRTRSEPTTAPPRRAESGRSRTSRTPERSRPVTARRRGACGRRVRRTPAPRSSPAGPRRRPTSRRPSPPPASWRPRPLRAHQHRPRGGAARGLAAPMLYVGLVKRDEVLHRPAADADTRAAAQAYVAVLAAQHEARAWWGVPWRAAAVRDLQDAFAFDESGLRAVGPVILRARRAELAARLAATEDGLARALTTAEQAGALLPEEVEAARAYLARLRALAAGVAACGRPTRSDAGRAYAATQDGTFAVDPSAASPTPELRSALTVPIAAAAAELRFVDPQLGRSGQALYARWQRAVRTWPVAAQGGVGTKAGGPGAAPGGTARRPPGLGRAPTFAFDRHCVHPVHGRPLGRARPGGVRRPRPCRGRRTPGPGSVHARVARRARGAVPPGRRRRARAFPGCRVASRPRRVPGPGCRARGRGGRSGRGRYGRSSHRAGGRRRGVVVAATLAAYALGPLPFGELARRLTARSAGALRRRRRRRGTRNSSAPPSARSPRGTRDGTVQRLLTR